MAKRKGGFRRKTRAKLRKNVYTRGKISIKDYMQSFTIGERVVFAGEPGVQKGMYFPRFHGRTGIVEKVQGACYAVSFKDGKKEKTMVVHPIHLKRVQEGLKK